MAQWQTSTSLCASVRVIVTPPQRQPPLSGWERRFGSLTAERLALAWTYESSARFSHFRHWAPASASRSGIPENFEGPDSRSLE
ncbi:hypothetical protein [Erythrobacter ani]|uniref:hypothetical protein n=1 Tax=Erythrobacter ani TaxID=2827235 RepID=UPI003F701C31